MAAPRVQEEPLETEGSEGRRGSSGVEVVFPPDPAAPAPMCPHGPTLLFVKVSHGKEEGKRFYACSACRDRKDCNFFQWEDDKLSGPRLAAREAHNRRCQPPLTRSQCVERYLKFIELPLSQRKFCQRCQQLLLPDDWGEHHEHEVMGDVSVTQLRRPSQLLYPLENKKTNAQYLFADRTCHFLVDLLSTLGFRRVLCVGTPRLHELIRLKASDGKESAFKSLLLDIDFRYSQFYMEDSFCHYNMFNHHFFDGKSAFEECRAFLQEDKGDGVIMVTDPPFGGLVEPLAVTLKKFIALWKEAQSQDDNHKELPIFWIFPYFFESRICQFFPNFCMLDYQDRFVWSSAVHTILDRLQQHHGLNVLVPVLFFIVQLLSFSFSVKIRPFLWPFCTKTFKQHGPKVLRELSSQHRRRIFGQVGRLTRAGGGEAQVDYENHALYKHGKTGRKQSPVRIFTNIPPNKIVLPPEEGYRFCPLCQRYVSLENQHCEHCDSCTSKDGRKWNHCFLCKKCVKPSWIHCSICNHCAVPYHSCEGPRAGCFICGALDHKRTACPAVSSSTNTNRAVRKPQQRRRKKMKLETVKGQATSPPCAARRKRRKDRAHQDLHS